MGRHKLYIDPDALRELAAQHPGLNALAAHFGVSRHVIADRLQAMGVGYGRKHRGRRQYCLSGLHDMTLPGAVDKRFQCIACRNMRERDRQAAKRQSTTYGHDQHHWDRFLDAVVEEESLPPWLRGGATQILNELRSKGA